MSGALRGPILTEDSLMINTKHYGTTPDGNEITEYTLTNINNMSVRIINYGAIITSITVPDQNGAAQEITLGFDKLEDYMENNTPYFGATVGRVTGRISNARFTLNHNVYSLSENIPGGHLHGGVPGFHRVVWDAEGYTDEESSGVVLHYLSADGEAGYPGNLGVVISYHLTDDNELFIDYQAESDAATPINLTNHTYWNLAGSTSGKIFDHELEIYADEYVVTDEQLMPTGEIAELEDTPLDFSEPTPMGKHLKEIKNGYGHDQCYILEYKPVELSLAAVVVEPSTGRKLECYTTQTGLQFYTGNNLAGEIGREGKPYEAYDGFCLEAQNWPDAINQNNFPNSVLKPGKEYNHTICFQLYF